MQGLILTHKTNGYDQLPIARDRRAIDMGNVSKKTQEMTIGPLTLLELGLDVLRLLIFLFLFFLLFLLGLSLRLLFLGGLLRRLLSGGLLGGLGLGALGGLSLVGGLVLGGFGFLGGSLSLGLGEAQGGDDLREKVGETH
jgi:hypothetical protein